MKHGQLGVLKIYIILMAIARSVFRSRNKPTHGDSVGLYVFESVTYVVTTFLLLIIVLNQSLLNSPKIM